MAPKASCVSHLPTASTLQPPPTRAASRSLLTLVDVAASRSKRVRRRRRWLRPTAARASARSGPRASKSERPAQAGGTADAIAGGAVALAHCTRCDAPRRTRMAAIAGCAAAGGPGVIRRASQLLLCRHAEQTGPPVWGPGGDAKMMLPPHVGRRSTTLSSSIREPTRSCWLRCPSTR